MVEEVSKAMEIANEVAEVVEVGYGTIIAIDQAISRVHGARVRLVMTVVAMWWKSSCCP